MIRNKMLFLLLFIFSFITMKNTYSLGKTGIIRYENANIKSEPDKKAKKIIEIPINSDIYIIELKNDLNTKLSFAWFKIKYQNYVGWIEGVYLFIINDDNFEATVLKLENEKNEKVLQSNYKSNYNGGDQPLLKLYKNRTFELSINRCAFIQNISGKYILKGDKLICYNIKYLPVDNDYTFRIIIKRLIIEFKILNEKELIITNDLVYNDGIESYGFCSPNKGDIFFKQ